VNLRLLRFNLLPSLTLHPDRAEDYASAPQRQALRALCDSDAQWHRHFSRHILETLQLHEQFVPEQALDQWAWVLLEPHEILRCARAIGAVIHGPALRRIVSGADVRELVRCLGDDALRYAREQVISPPDDEAALASSFASAFASSYASSLAPVGGAGLAAAVELAGRAVLRTALTQAEPALALRATLKLPDETIPAISLAPPQCLRLTRDVLETLDFPCHSSSPAMH
jgi:type III secretion protein K